MGYEMRIRSYRIAMFYFPLVRFERLYYIQMPEEKRGRPGCGGVGWGGVWRVGVAMVGGLPDPFLSTDRLSLLDLTITT